jgi:hypothetical protein
VAGVSGLGPLPRGRVQAVLQPQDGAFSRSKIEGNIFGLVSTLQ